MVVKKAELARELGCSKARLTQLGAAGMPVLADGRLDREQALGWIAQQTAGEQGGWDGATRKHSLAARAARLLSGEVVQAAVEAELAAAAEGPVRIPFIPAATASTAAGPERLLVTGQPGLPFLASGSAERGHVEEPAASVERSHAQEAAALARVRREKIELEVAAQRGELLPAQEVMQAWSEMVIAVRNRILLAVDSIPDATARAQASRPIREALEDLARLPAQEAEKAVA